MHANTVNILEPEPESPERETSPLTEEDPAEASISNSSTEGLDFVSRAEGCVKEAEQEEEDSTEDVNGYHCPGFPVYLKVRYMPLKCLLK